jgi:hypothetical protein
MVRGLATGEADRDQDGYVDLDELYDYVYDSVREVTPHQTPGKWTFGVQGDLVIARRNSPVTDPATLPADLQHSLDSPLAGVRAGAVSELARLGAGRHQGLALAARKALEELTEDDSRTVVAAATAALAAVPERAPASVRAASPTAPSPVAYTPRAEPAERSGRRRAPRVPSSTRGRVAVASAIVLLAAASGYAVWHLVVNDEPPATTTIPASFDGEWKGTGGLPNGSPSEFTVTLAEGLRIGRLANDSSCFSGSLGVAQGSTEDELTLRFTPGGTDCNPWTVVLEHNERVDDELAMHVDPDPADPYEGDFDIALRRTG